MPTIYSYVLGRARDQQEIIEVPEETTEETEEETEEEISE